MPESKHWKTNSDTANENRSPMYPMPYAVVKVPGGYKVRNLISGKHYSNSPMTLAVAKKQLSVLNRAGH